jgi:F-type H+-transporting ATPase subunit gamma
MNYLVDSYIKSSITNLLFQSLLAEQASRFLAMDNATNNAENLLEKLNLQYNKSRQAIITKELSELSSSLNE